MKILFYLGGLNKGGAERVATNLCNYFVENGNDVKVIVTRLDEIGYNINEKIKIKSLEITKSKKKIIRNLKLLKKLNQEILNYNPDIIISFLKEPNARILILKTFSRKVKKIPSIISVRVDPKRLYKEKLSKIFVKLFYNKSNGYVFQTKEVQNFFCPNIIKKSTIIANPVDDEFIQKPSKIRKNKIVSVGRLEKQKNHKLLIDAFEKFSNENENYELQIFGEGKLKKELEDYILTKQLEKKVFLMGNTSKIIDNIKDASMFVLSSDYEGMPNALMEAMALGIPCISTKCSGGGAEFLIDNNENGILVEKNDVLELKKAMMIISQNKELSEKISKNANEKMKKFRTKNINEEWMKYIQKIQKGEQ